MLATLSLCSLAYAPAAPVAARAVAPARCSISAGIPGMVGDCAPLGFFDPLGFSKDPEKAKLYREAELKHGRAAMLAAFGYLTTANGFHPYIDAMGVAPGATPLADAGSIPGVAWFQIFALCAAIEGFTTLLSKNPGYKAGDYLGASEYMDADDLGWQRYQLAELNNGRLAMMGIIGLIYESAAFDKFFVLGN